MRVIILENYDRLSAWAANYIAAKINAYAPTEDRPLFWDLRDLPPGHIQGPDIIASKGKDLFKKCDHLQYG